MLFCIIFNINARYFKQKDYKLMPGKITAGLLGGFIVAVPGFMVVMVVLINKAESAGSTGAAFFFAFWVLGIVIALLAKTKSKAWRHIMFLSAALSFMLPLLSFFYSTAAGTEAVSQGDDPAVGAVFTTLIDFLFIDASGILGYLFGIIFFIIGFFVGREKQLDAQ
jgi:hypothetical protein